VVRVRGALLGCAIIGSAGLRPGARSIRER
jgi:hypothetical protein